MTPEDWKKINHFKPDERTPWGAPNAFGDPLRMNLFLMLEIDAFREYVGFPFNVHCGYDPHGHKDGSYHDKNGWGCAIDFSCPAMDEWELHEQATKFRFDGIGVYPFWNRPGLHVDVRGNGRYKPKVYWHRDAMGNYHYF